MEKDKNILDSQSFLERAASHFQQALGNLPQLLGKDFPKAVDIIKETKGHLICCGMGKSGLIAQKMSATFSSTGTPSFFLHPAEALHGDLGAITKDDTLLLISNSGETKELTAILPSIKKFGNQCIAFTGRLNSTLDQYAHVTLPVSVDRELCPNDLAPTTSTLITLATGDLLAVALMELRDFSERDFARYHPGGSLGRKLLMQVKDSMVKTPLPQVSPKVTLQDAIMVITEGRLGLTLVLDDTKSLKGIITDGDLRRALLSDSNALKKPCEEFMSQKPLTVHQNTNLAEAEEMMLAHKIKFLIAIDDQKKVSGILEIYST